MAGGAIHSNRSTQSDAQIVEWKWHPDAFAEAGRGDEASSGNDAQPATRPEKRCRFSPLTYEMLVDGTAMEGYDGAQWRKGYQKGIQKRRGIRRFVREASQCQ